MFFVWPPGLCLIGDFLCKILPESCRVTHPGLLVIMVVALASLQRYTMPSMLILLYHERGESYTHILIFIFFADSCCTFSNGLACQSVFIPSPGKVGKINRFSQFLSLIKAWLSVASPEWHWSGHKHLRRSPYNEVEVTQTRIKINYRSLYPRDVLVLLRIAGTGSRFTDFSLTWSYYNNFCFNLSFLNIKQLLWANCTDNQSVILQQYLYRLLVLQMVPANPVQKLRSIRALKPVLPAWVDKYAGRKYHHSMAKHAPSSAHKYVYCHPQSEFRPWLTAPCFNQIAIFSINTASRTDQDVINTVFLAFWPSSVFCTSTWPSSLTFSEWDEPKQQMMLHITWRSLEDASRPKICIPCLENNETNAARSKTQDNQTLEHQHKWGTTPELLKLLAQFISIFQIKQVWRMQRNIDNTSIFVDFISQAFSI